MKVFEIAAKGEGRYASARDINAKFTTCDVCTKRIEKKDALAGSNRTHLCKRCHDIVRKAK